MSIRSTVLETMTRIGEQQGKALRPLTDSLPLLDSGLDSLCIAIIVATLDDELGLDPFSAADLDFPVTVGDFIGAYDTAGHAAT